MIIGLLVLDLGYVFKQSGGRVNKLLILILVISLICINGCTTLGNTAGKENSVNEELVQEKIKTIKENSRLTILLKNNEVLKGKFISCVNDTLCVAFEASENLNTPISNSQFLIIPDDMASYKIPVDQIKNIHIGKVDYKAVGTISEVAVVILVILIISAFKTMSNISGK